MTTTMNLTGTTTTPRKLGNRHGDRLYPAGTLVEIIREGADGWCYSRVVGTRSIKGYVHISTINPA